MATTVQTFTNGGTTNQPFGSASGLKMIDNFSSADLVAGNTDPYQGIAFYKIESVNMTVGGTSGTTNAARMGLWKSAGVLFDITTVTLNGVTASVSSATASVTGTINAVIAGGTTYYAGTWASASLASKRDTATGSFSSYSGSNTSTTVATTYNPGNLRFVLKYYYLPDAPAAPTITSKTSTSVTIGWSAPSDPGGYAATTLRYKVKWTSASGGSSIAVAETAVNATSATITGLVPGETYQFYVAAMNAVIPTGAGSYTSTDGSVYIDANSSGPYSPASTATKLNGGIWDGTTWRPIYYAAGGSRTIRVTRMPATAFTNGKVYGLDSFASVQVNTVAQPVFVGDTVTITGTSSPAGFNGTWGVDSVGGSSGAWTIYFYQNYFNPNVSDLNTTPTTGTVSSTAFPRIKAYNGTSWVTLV